MAFKQCDKILDTLGSNQQTHKGMMNFGNKAQKTGTLISTLISGQAHIHNK